MAILPQGSLFSWNEIAGLGDLERLKLVLEHLPDEALMQKLEKARGKGRDDYPVRAMWNAYIALVVFQHPSVESLRRELSRNGQLRWLLGFGDRVPSAAAFSRFWKRVEAHEAELESLFVALQQAVATYLSDYGKRLALDSKAIRSYARHRPKNTAPDGRRDKDADYGFKTVRDREGNATKLRWFGYKLHLIVDSTHELPVAYTVTPASKADVATAHALLEKLQAKRPEVLARAEVLAADKGYDDTKLIVRLWDEHRIRPVIDIRASWRDGEATRLFEGQTNVVYDNEGRVFCVCPETGTMRTMAEGGFEAARGTLKKRCPAKAYGLPCAGVAQCPAARGLRIRMEVNRRLFTPIARGSARWAREYRKRTAVERVFSRLDTMYGFETHTIRGLKKMRVRVGLALVVMLGMALGRLREGLSGNLRSFVQVA